MESAPDCLDFNTSWNQKSKKDQSMFSSIVNDYQIQMQSEPSSSVTVGGLFRQQSKIGLSVNGTRNFKECNLSRNVDKSQKPGLCFPG